MLGSLAGCAGLLATAELGARLLAGDATAGGLRELHDYSAVYGWTPRPHARVLDEAGSVSINALGYRGRLVPERPAPELRRVLMLGDSITFGLDVDDSQTFAALLDAGDNGLEVVNLAVQGYGLDQDLLKLEREGLRFSPDLVVLNVCLDNDLADTALPAFLYDERQPKPYFTNQGGQLRLHDEHLRRPWSTRVAAGLQRHSRLYSRWIADTRLSARADEHWTDRKANVLRNADAVQDLSFRLIARMSAVATSDGARLIVVLHPDKASFRMGSQWGAAFLTSPLLEGIPIVDLRHRYRAQGLRWRDLANDTIGHLSPQGHRAAATILEDVLREALPRGQRAASPPRALTIG